MGVSLLSSLPFMVAFLFAMSSLSAFPEVAGASVTRHYKFEVRI